MRFNRIITYYKVHSLLELQVSYLTYCYDYVQFHSYDYGHYDYAMDSWARNLVVCCDFLMVFGFGLGIY